MTHQLALCAQRTWGYVFAANCGVGSTGRDTRCRARPNRRPRVGVSWDWA